MSARGDARATAGGAAAAPGAELGRAPLIALAGALTIAFSAILVRKADVHPVTAALYRCAYAIPLLAALAWRERRRYGPRASGSDAWTIDAADGGLESHAGPSWRMIVDWTGHGSATAEGIYPGGQSENPASPWYTDQMADWWDGRYLPMPPAAGAAAGPIRWNLAPGGQGSGHG